jgi:DNA-binding transcriptional LysR family regulator
MHPMTPEHAVQFTSGSPDTVLDPLDAAVATALERAESLPLEQRRLAVAVVAAADPRCLPAWADLAELATDPVEKYAYARVGYHRGLDALRAAGWRGSGYVRWRDEPNRGFLRSLDALRQAAQTIGEVDEEQRCDLFLRQLDPEWGSRGD